MKADGMKALLGCCLAGLSGCLWGQAGGGSTPGKPLPNVDQLRQRALQNYAKTSEMRERYLCRERVTTHELDGKGGVKKTEVYERESFFVHGHPINQTLTKDGKPLSESEQRKQAETVRKAIEEAMKPGSKKRPDGEMRMSEFLRLSRLTSERRVMVAGRPTIVFDAMGDADAKANSMGERFMQAMAGTISIDEQTGIPQDINMRGMRDVKVGGGLVANVHKGFGGHAVIAPQPDGVWLLEKVEGAGDARVGLFLHPSVRFEQQTEGCKLSNVTSDSVEKLGGNVLERPADGAKKRP